jgi:hypothetical protein
MPRLQMVGQQRGGPDRRAIAQFARVAINDLKDQRCNDAVSRPRAATAGIHREAAKQVTRGAPLEALHPIVDGLACDSKTCGALWDTRS